MLDKYANWSQVWFTSVVYKSTDVTIALRIHTICVSVLKKINVADYMRQSASRQDN